MKATWFAAVVIAWPGLASALPIAGELHLGGGLDSGSSGDVASYVTLEPSGRIESLHCGWITLALAGSVELDALAFDRSGGTWERMQGRPDVTVHLAPSFGVVHPRLRVRLGPWLLITNRDRRQVTVSLLPYGNGFIEWGAGRNRWYLQAYEQVPYASSGSGFHAGLTRLSGYGPFSKVSGSIYLTPPLLLGLASRHEVPWGTGRSLVLGASAGYDLGERLVAKRGVPFEVMLSIGVAWSAAGRDPSGP